MESISPLRAREDTHGGFTITLWKKWLILRRGNEKEISVVSKLIRTNNNSHNNNKKKSMYVFLSNWNNCIFTYAYSTQFKKTRGYDNTMIVVTIMLRMFDIRVQFMQCIVRKCAHSLSVFRSYWWFVCRTPIDPHRTSAPSFSLWKQRTKKILDDWCQYRYASSPCFAHKIRIGAERSEKRPLLYSLVWGDPPDLGILIVRSI